jgi:hypothetical protein
VSEFEVATRIKNSRKKSSIRVMNKMAGLSTTNSDQNNVYVSYQPHKRQRTGGEMEKNISSSKPASSPSKTPIQTGIQKEASWNTMLENVESLGSLGTMPGVNPLLEKRPFSIGTILPTASTTSSSTNADKVPGTTSTITFATGSGGNQKFIDVTTGEYMYPADVNPMTFHEKQRLVQKITLLPSQYLRGLMDVISKYQPDTVRQIDDDGYAFDLGQMNENTVWAISDYVKESMIELDGYIKSISSANLTVGENPNAKNLSDKHGMNTSSTSDLLRHHAQEVALTNAKINAIYSNENQTKFMEQVQLYSKPKITKSRVKPSKKHECPTCAKQFRGRSELQNHLRTHTGEKPLKCSFAGCNKRYAHSSNLRAHERTHAGVKPYACHYDGCGKSFAHSVSLKEHIWMHAGFQPYECPYDGCDKKFTQVSNFARHKKTHEKEEQQQHGD